MQRSRRLHTLIDETREGAPLRPGPLRPDRDRRGAPLGLRQVRRHLRLLRQPARRPHRHPQGRDRPRHPTACSIWSAASPPTPTASTTPPRAPSPSSSKDLTAFLDLARNNQYATFANHRDAVAVLERIDSAFMRIGLHLLNPQDQLTPFFLYRSHSALRAASACAMAGQTVETFVLLRSCLEFAAYALQIDKVPGARQKWLDRHRDVASRKAATNAFRTDNLRPTIAGCDARLGKLFDTFYRRCIEYGAHPNEHASMGSRG